MVVCSTLREWQKTVKSNEGRQQFIVQGSPVDGFSGWQPWPIGMQSKYTMVCNQLGSKLQLGPHNKTLMVSFVTSTDLRRRPNPKLNRLAIERTLRANQWENKHIASQDYFQILPHYKFVVSPEGNGIDCHRHYEALMAGCIPIMEQHPLTEAKYAGCPVLYTTDYSEITAAYLEKKYTEMLDTMYDFSRLFLFYYSAEEQAEIKRCGNYWMAKLQNGKVWYDNTKPAPLPLLLMENIDPTLVKTRQTGNLKLNIDRPVPIFSNLNTTLNCHGRFINHFFLNNVAHLVCQKGNLKFTYGYAEQFRSLGITFFDQGTLVYPTHITYEIPKEEAKLKHFLFNPNCIVKANLYFSGNRFYQNKPFAHFLHDYYTQPKQKNKIIAANKYKVRYNANNDYFVHVRLGDVAKNTVGYEYYAMVLSRLATGKQGYIASDTIDHPICQQLILQYNLQIMTGDEVTTIMFGSTCKTIVLSAGTFSWFIGLLGFYSDVYYPDYAEQLIKWHPDIYLTTWNTVKGFTLKTKLPSSLPPPSSPLKPDTLPVRRKHIFRVMHNVMAKPNSRITDGRS